MSEKSTEQDKLRKAAEAKLQYAPDTKQMPRPTERLLHELRVHQIELEMQNETLRQSQIELEKSRDRYVAFYDFTTVGYLTLTDNGMIAEANLTSTKLFGVERNKLQHYRFDRLVAPEYRDRWHRLFMSVMQNMSGAVNLVLQRDDGSSFKAHIDCRRDETDIAKPVLCITITDLSEHSNLRQHTDL